MSEKGSKENVAESETPLLSDDATEKTETTEKEDVEKEEKKDETTEKEDNKKEKKKKEKKVKVPKVPKPKGPSCVETMSSGLDMNTRDKEGINVEIDVRVIHRYVFANESLESLSMTNQRHHVSCQTSKMSCVSICH